MQTARELVLTMAAATAFASCGETGNTVADAGPDAGIDTESDADAGPDAGEECSPDVTCPIRVIGEGGDDCNSGSAWEEGLATIERGLDLAEPLGCDVWVKAGTYYPTEDLGGSSAPEDPRTVTFVLRAGVAIYGGFAGDETSLEQRDIAANETILSGDIGTLDNNSDNSYHVVTGADEATIDGFTVTGGSADYDLDCTGGGMYNSYASPTVLNCTFSGNSSAGFGGGGMANLYSSPTVESCAFSENSARFGAGMLNLLSSPTVTSSSFSDNISEFNGSGMWNSSSSPTLVDCVFEYNLSSNWYIGSGGGGMNNTDNSSPIVENCIFFSNAAADGGGMRNVGSSSPVVTNCVFLSNWGGIGGGMFNDDSSPTIINCTFSDNNSEPGECGGILNHSSSPVITNSVLWGSDIVIDELLSGYTSAVTYSNVQGGCSVASGCTSDDIGNIDLDPLFVSTTDVHLQPGSPCIDAANGDAAPEFDIEGNPRVDDPAVVDTGVGTITFVDMGAYEYLF